MCGTYKTQHISYELKKNKLEPAIIWKLVTCQRITSKRYWTSMGRHLSPRYGQVILVSGYSVLTAVNWSQHWCAIYVCNISLPVLPNWLESVRIKHWFPCGADGRAGGRSVYGHVITKFSGMGRFTYPWCSAGALRAPELRYYIISPIPSKLSSKSKTVLPHPKSVLKLKISFRQPKCILKIVSTIRRQPKIPRKIPN